MNTLENCFPESTNSDNKKNINKKILWLLSLNSYGRENYDINKLELYKEELILKFKEIHKKYWFKEINDIPVSSDVDKSVILIWSHISVLKQYFLSWNFWDNNGLVIKQECIRTHNLSHIFNDDIIPKWWSCFTSLWSISHPKWLITSCELLFSYLINKLNIPIDNILIRVNSKDNDLINAIYKSNYIWKVEFDTKPETYYRHKLWLWDIKWRNFNIALRHGNTEIFNDIWNIIVIEDDNKIYTTEIALWLNVILMEIYWLDNIFQTTPIEKYYSINENLHPKLKDCIISSLHLLNEWIKPIASNNKWRILRKYIRWILYFTKKMQLDINSIIQICSNYENDCFKNNTWTNIIKEYILWYEKLLLTKTDFSDEDKILKSVL